jgi:hypothetical protein
VIEGKRLYTTWDVSTETGNEVFQAAINALEPMMKAWVGRGYSIRDIAHEMQSAVTMLEAETCIRRNMKAHKDGEKAPPTR